MDNPGAFSTDWARTVAAMALVLSGAIRFFSWLSPATSPWMLLSSVTVTILLFTLGPRVLFKLSSKRRDPIVMLVIVLHASLLASWLI